VELGQGAIAGVPAQISTNTPLTVTLQVPGMDLSAARVVWEARARNRLWHKLHLRATTDRGSGGSRSAVADGRRAFAVANLFAADDLPTVTITSTDTTATEGATDTASFTLTSSTAATWP